MKSIAKKIIIWILTIEARLVLLRYKPKIVVVTGTVGKTSTKDAIFAVFSNFFYTRKSQKSFNSDIGVPLAILDLDTAWGSVWGWLKNIIIGASYVFLPNRYPNWLILEIGTDTPGDVRRIAKWLKPEVVVMTRFADIPVHVEFFDSPEDVIAEEQSIARALKKDGFLIVNNDDEHAVALRKELDMKSISFGVSKKSGVQASHVETLYTEMGQYKKPTGIRFRADYEEMSGPVLIGGALGVQHVYPVLAALAAGISQDLNMVKMSGVFGEEFKTPPGRMKLIDGRKNSVIIDDTYNSSPIAAERALETIRDLEAVGRRVALLGDMRELGKFSSQEHERIGLLAGQCVDLLVCVGDNSTHVSSGALKAGLPENCVYEFATSEQASIFMAEHLKENDIVLVKGSQSTRMERVVEAIMANPENRKKVLVRQEEEWVK